MAGLRVGMIVSVVGATLLALARVAPADVSAFAFDPAGIWASGSRQFADGSSRFAGGPLLPVTNRQ